jgi:hypothetical protein
MLDYNFFTFCVVKDGYLLVQRDKLYDMKDYPALADLKVPKLKLDVLLST